MPAAVQILLVFAAVVALPRLRVPLGLSLVAGGLALDAIGGQGPATVAADLGRALAQPALWLLLAIIAGILMLSHFMTKEEDAGVLVSAVRRWGGRHGRVLAVAAAPAFIGLIPMPAGAVVSAPFVERSMGGGRWTPDWKSAVNYWFRHVWEYWWPLYPGAIIAMSVMEIDTWQFVAAQFVFTPISIGAGYLFLLRPHFDDLAAHEDRAAAPDARTRTILPALAVVVGLVLLGSGPLRLLAPGLDLQTRKMLVMLIATGAGVLVFTAVHGGAALARAARALLARKTGNLLASVGGVLVFGSLLAASGLVPRAARELVASGIPVVSAVMTLPFLAGFVTGLAAGFTGISFPILVELTRAAPASAGLTPLATLALAYSFGFMGMMFSPVHLCLLATQEYFDARLERILLMILPCGAFVLAAGFAVHYLFRWLGW